MPVAGNEGCTAFASGALVEIDSRSLYRPGDRQGYFLRSMRHGSVREAE